MTKTYAGKAVDGIWTKVKGLRDTWVLIAFVASTLIWVEGTVRVYVSLPEQVGLQAEVAADMTRRLVDIERHLEKLRCSPSSWL